MQHPGFHLAGLLSAAVLLAGSPTPCVAEDAPADPAKIAAEVDRLILAEYPEDSVPGVVDDAVYLRRVSLDIAGRPASPEEITLFGLDPAPGKRQEVVDRLLADTEYGVHWSRYWRDAMFTRATNVRANLVRNQFEEWAADSLNQGVSWSDFATELLTAEGKVYEDGRTALLFIHEGQAEEIAAESSRLFLGIQVQCANCHDHPWDRWKRDEFHQFTAFFPRVSVRRDRESDNMFDYVVASVDQERRRNPAASRFLLTRLDRDKDLHISEEEAQNSPLQRIFNSQAQQYIDRDGDGRLSIEEIATAEPPDANRPGQGSVEHFMPDLSDPSSEGTRVDPAFFLKDVSLPPGMTDQARRFAASRLITQESNIWFSRAIVNRMWSELTGSAFCTPIDDIGPDRAVLHEEALDLLCREFRRSGDDLKWLVRCITATRLYQRPLNADAEGMIRRLPQPLSSDQLYNCVCSALNTNSVRLPFTGGGRRGPAARGRDQGRDEFESVFGFDPSVPDSDVLASVPEALLLMNSPELNRLVTSRHPAAAVTQAMNAADSVDGAIRELFIRTVGREPSEAELTICGETAAQADSERAGLEDVLWALLNGSEFRTKK